MNQPAWNAARSPGLSVPEAHHSAAKVARSNSEDSGLKVSMNRVRSPGVPPARVIGVDPIPRQRELRGVVKQVLDHQLDGQHRQERQHAAGHQDAEPVAEVQARGDLDVLQVRTPGASTRRSSAAPPDRRGPPSTGRATPTGHEQCAYSYRLLPFTSGACAHKPDMSTDQKTQLPCPGPDEPSAQHSAHRSASPPHSPAARRSSDGTQLKKRTSTRSDRP